MGPFCDCAPQHDDERKLEDLASGSSRSSYSSAGKAAAVPSIKVPTSILNTFYDAEVATFTKVPGGDGGEHLNLATYMLRSARKAQGCRFAPVTLHVYDTLWLAKQVGLPTFHNGIEILGMEIFFGDMGVSCCRPGRYDPKQYRGAMPLGHTSLRDDEVLLVLQELELDWPRGSYSFNGRNCQTFAAAVCNKLGLANAIPQEYLAFAEPWATVPWVLLARISLEGTGALLSPKVPPVGSTTDGSTMQSFKQALTGTSKQAMLGGLCPPKMSL